MKSRILTIALALVAGAAGHFGTTAARNALADDVEDRFERRLYDVIAADPTADTTDRLRFIRWVAQARGRMVIR